MKSQTDPSGPRASFLLLLSLLSLPRYFLLIEFGSAWQAFFVTNNFGRHSISLSEISSAVLKRVPGIQCPMRDAIAVFPQAAVILSLIMERDANGSSWSIHCPQSFVGQIFWARTREIERHGRGDSLPSPSFTAVKLTLRISTYDVYLFVRRPVRDGSPRLSLRVLCTLPRHTGGVSLRPSRGSLRSPG